MNKISNICMEAGMGILYLVVPCYNEEEVLPESSRIMRQKIVNLIGAGKISPESRVMFVDDGSTDGTWSILHKLCQENANIDAVKLSRNRGHQNALMAGLVTAIKYSDFTISMDADLQDDIDAIDEMIEKYEEGAEIVCGVRRSRTTDSFLKSSTAHAFYSLMNLFGARVIYDHADFRLMSSEAVRRLCRYGTEDLFIRGLITRLNLPLEKVKYDRLPRLAGESKYTLRKMLHLAARGFSCGKMKPSGDMQVGELYIERVEHG